MAVPKVRIGDFIKLREKDWVSLRSIVEISINYQGKEGMNKDDYEVQLLLNISDYWLPGPLPEENIRDIDKFYRQINDPCIREVFRGTMKECEAVVDQILYLDPVSTQKEWKSLMDASRAEENSSKPDLGISENNKEFDSFITNQNDNKFDLGIGDEK